MHTRSKIGWSLWPVLLTIGSPTGAVLAQLNSNDIDFLRQQGETEGWTFTVRQNSATGRSLDTICKLQEPEGWQPEAQTTPLELEPSGQAVLPTAWDWRALGGCTPVKNQASCGSCWAFATVGALECAIRIDSGLTKDLSEQYLISCNNSGYSCSGGWFAHDYHYNVAGKSGGIGAVLESAKPYTVNNAACGGPFAHLYVVNNWSYIAPYPTPTTNAIKQAIMTYGPVSVAVYVNNAFQAYSGGVFNASQNLPVNHAVVLVGWNDSEQAWIMRNSWGTGWGESGYMRIRYGCSRIGYGACYVDYGGGAATAGATITSPAPDSVLASSSATFQWAADPNATEYWLAVGNNPTRANFYNQPQGTGTSATVHNLPVDGKPLYVRLFSKINGQWCAKTATYTAATLPPASAQMTSPAGGSTLGGSSVTFEWTAGTSVTEYALWIGTAFGTCNLYNKTQGLNRSVVMTNLPTTGQTLYVRLMSRIAGRWQMNEYTYTAATDAGVSAVMTNPVNGSALNSATVTFEWSEGIGVTEYSLQIGTTPGARNLYYRSQKTSRSVVIAGLPGDGRVLYLRLWSKCSGGWQYNDYTYTAANLVTEAAELTSPANGSTFGSNTATFEWSEGVAVAQYRLNIGTTVGGTELYNKSLGLSRSVTVTNLPLNGGPVYVRLWSYIANRWQQRDYAYTAATAAAAPAEITSPASGSTLSSAIVVFQWSEGMGATEYWLSIGTAAGSANLYNKGQGRNRSVTVASLPTNGSMLYVRLRSKIQGVWQDRDCTFRAASAPSGTAAEITSPAPGSTLNSTTVTFQWAANSVAEYWLAVGSESGARDLYDQAQGTNASATVSGLPADGRQLYVRLWTRTGDSWQYRDYTYTAAGG